MTPIKIGLYGVTGYTGYELFQLLQHHPEMQIKFITSERQAGKSLHLSWPNAPQITLQSAEQADLDQVDCVFLCLPHTRSADIASQAVSAGVNVIDLSADLRFTDPVNYEKWYHIAHPHPELLPVPYGLPELDRQHLHGAKVIANPGCYATAMLLGLQPLAQQGLILSDTPVIVDAKSGATGAGRTPRQNTLFSEVHGNLTPYNIGRAHRHLGEVEQQLAVCGMPAGQLVFTPHLLPTDRGILAAIYAPVKDAVQAEKVIREQYDQEPLVRLLPEGDLAALAHVVRTPLAVISLTAVGTNLLIVMVAIDNLLKGASSQAVQNFNLMYGFPETTGLLKDQGGVL